MLNEINNIDVAGTLYSIRDKVATLCLQKFARALSYTNDGILTEPGFYNYENVFTSNSAYKSFTCSVTAGDVVRMTTALPASSNLPMYYLLDASTNVVYRKELTVASGTAIHDNLYVIIPEGVSYIRCTTHVSTEPGELKKAEYDVTFESLQLAIDAVTDQIASLENDIGSINSNFEKDLDLFVPPNVLAAVSFSTLEGYIWNSSGSLQTQYAAKYTSIDKLLEVTPDTTYKIPNFKGFVMLYNQTATTGVQLMHTSAVSDFEFTVPSDKYKIAICYVTGESSDVTSMYRLTPTANELAELPFSMELLSLLPENFRTEEVRQFILDLIPSGGFEADTDAFIPPNILSGLSFDISEGYFWGASGLVSNEYTARYTSIDKLIDVIPGNTYKIPNFYGVVSLYNNSNYEGHTQLSFTSSGDAIIEIPEGKYKIGVSWVPAIAAFTYEVYRLTPTQAEMAALPTRSDAFSLSAENLKSENIKELLTPLKDKIIVNFGDSIFGMFQPPEDVSTAIAAATGATVYNCGFGGCRMAYHPSTYYDPFSMYRLADAVVSRDFTLQQAALDAASAAGQTGALVTMFPTTLNRLRSIDFTKVDIITIAYGTNDFAGSVPLKSAANAYDTDTFVGALRYSIEEILEAYPNVRIFLCTPIYRAWIDSSNAFMYDSDTYTNSSNTTLLDFVDSVKDVAREYHLPYVDNYHNLGINKINRLQYFPVNDGTHPNLTGRKLIGKHIAKNIY